MGTHKEVSQMDTSITIKRLRRSRAVKALTILVLVLVLLTLASAPLSAKSPDVTADAVPPVTKPTSIPPIPPGYSREVFEVKFREGTRVRLRRDQLTGLSAQASEELSFIFQKYPVVSISRLFTQPEEKLDRMRITGEKLSGKPLPDLNLWYRFTLKSGADAEAFIDAIKRLPDVEIVEPAPLPAPPPALTPDFMPLQGYLNAATAGIDARYAWRVPGGNGTGVTIYDAEYSWNQNHEDLSKAHGVTQLLGPNTDPFSDNNHGTAVLGELIADFNHFGVTGISWGAGIGLAPTHVGGSYNLANAINAAAAVALPGDVILIEQQTSVCGLGGCDATTQNGCGPSEWVASVFAAIQTAVANGIVVVEAAGNGNVDLDQPACGTTFDRTVQDSGAIIVGAGGPPGATDRQRLGFSSYGSRVDLQGWGSGVWTAGYGSGYVNPDDPTNPDYWYANSFGGTSSASPIIAGAVANLQGIAKTQAGGPLTPSYVRTLLVQTGSPQLPNNAQNIGPRPNLRQAISQLLVTDLSVTKTAEPDTAVPGTLLTYEVTVRNNGPDFAPNVVVTDVLPTEVTYLDDTDSCVENPVGTLVCSLGDLAAYSSRTFSINVLVDPAATGTITNTVTVDSDASDSNNTNDTFQLATALSPLADLKITKVSKPDTHVRAGEFFTYTIFVDNLGPSYARGVQIDDDILSSGAFTIDGITTDPARNDACGVPAGTTRVECQLLEALEPVGEDPPTGGQSGRWIIKVRVSADETQDVNNLVRVFTGPIVPFFDSGTPDPNMANNQAEDFIYVTDVSDLEITKTAVGEVQVSGQPGLVFDITTPGTAFPQAPNYTTSPSQVTAGRRIQYTLIFTNTGPSTAENVLVLDRLPKGVTIYPGSLVVSQGACETGTPGEPLDRMKCGIGTIPPGGTRTIRFQVLVDPSLAPGTVLENDVFVTSDIFDPDNGDNHAHTLTTVNTWADMSIAKSAVGDNVIGYDEALRRFIYRDLPSEVTAGRELRYTISVQNNGPSDAQNVQVMDVLPDLFAGSQHYAVTFLRAVGASCRPDDEHELWTILWPGDTASGQQIVCDLGTMAAGARVTFDIYVHVDPSVPQGTVIDNGALVLFGPSSPPAQPPSLFPGSPNIPPTLPYTNDPSTDDNFTVQRTTVNAVADIFITKVDVPAEARLDKTFEPDQAIAGNEHRYLITFGNNGPSVARSVNVTDTLDFKQAGILGETFVRCESLDPDDLVTCAFSAPNIVTVTRLQVGNEAVIPSAGNGTLNPGDSFSFYLITKVDPGYVLDADATGTEPNLIAENTAFIASTTT
ncbi:MAG: DUF11 domain-containing protein, partial [Chloroflexi bacterium]|nr:DUF11 domain-containing protein [Chloroflexota bacterium]